jgi:hypothetical protein
MEAIDSYNAKEPGLIQRMLGKKELSYQVKGIKVNVS